MKLSIKTIKKIGMGATVLGAITSLIANWASEKQTEASIAEKVAEAVAKLPASNNISEVVETIVESK